jgi:hypothetical protein
MKPQPEDAQVNGNGSPTADQGSGGLPATLGPDGLPSPHQDQAALLVGELKLRHAQFLNGKTALEGELEGKEQEFEEAHRVAQAKHSEVRAGLMARIEIMVRGISICEAAIAESEGK